MQWQVTQKRSKMEFKTLDSTLQTVNRESGAKQAMTHRCADLDKLVPGLMGVSKARRGAAAAARLVLVLVVLGGAEGGGGGASQPS